MRSRGCCRRRRTWDRAGSPRSSRRWRARSPLASGRTGPGPGGVCDLGSESDHLAQVGDGAVQIALVPVRAGSIIVGLGVLGIEPDRLAVVGDGAVEVALAPVREPPLMVGDGGIFRSFAAALDDARAGGDAAIRIVPLASIPVGPARGH